MRRPGDVPAFPPWLRFIAAISMQGAEARSRNLLRQWLSADERELFNAKGYLDVIGCHSGKRYRIYYGVVSNVRELDEDGKPRLGVCFAPEGALPVGDVMLAQKIALETHEQSTRALANCFPTALPPPQPDRLRSFR